MAEDQLPPAIPPSVPPAQQRQRPQRPAATPETNPPSSAASSQPPSFPPASSPARRSIKSGAPSADTPGQRAPQPPPAAASPMPPAIAPRRGQPERSTAPQSWAADPWASYQTSVAPGGRVATPHPTAPLQGSPATPRKRRRRRWPVVLLVVLALILAWPAWLLFDTNGRLGRENVLVAGPQTPGTTYLLAGSDERAADSESTVEGRRSDSIILIHKATNGQTSMVSLPRDTYVDIPGYGYNKLNASYSFGGPALLIETVQNLTGLTIDHYVQVNMEGFGSLVDAVDGVELCLDMDVDDPKSKLTWEAGCHHADGETALAFARMRYQDPRGDIGRAERQRQVIEAIAKKALSPQTLVNPFQQQRLAKSGAAALTVDESASVFTIAQLLLAFRSAGQNGLSGTPPLASISEQTEVGSVVLLDEDRAPGFFDRLAQGELTASDFDSDL